MLYQKILDKTIQVDNNFSKYNEEQLNKLKIVFSVPKSHRRNKKIKSYSFCQLPLEKIPLRRLYQKYTSIIFLVDSKVARLIFVNRFLDKKKQIYILHPAENKTKTVKFLNSFIRQNAIKKNGLIIVIGGGLLCNCGAYIAEQTASDYILFPTTVLAMADGALGGKVRANLVSKKRYKKHYYKAYYEPNAVFLDGRFLKSLPLRQKKNGTVEIIKHALFQSPGLYLFLSKNKGRLFSDDKFLKKAILWAADLKRICLQIDPNETKNGSERILRGGHKLSDKLEENQKLEIPHGFAVSVGIIKQLTKGNNKDLLYKAKALFTKLHIPQTLDGI